MNKYLNLSRQFCTSTIEKYHTNNLLCNIMNIQHLDSEKKHSYIYVRVNSDKQKKDLEKQSKFLLSKYPTFTIIKDVGSGVNFRRPGLLKLLELSDNSLVENIVITNKNVLCNFGFGFDLIKYVFEQKNVNLIIDEINK